MPQLIGDLINSLALKAGINGDDESLKSLLASPELQKINVPDELATSMERGLLNIEAAKNNHPDIKKKYFADAYDGMDRFLLQQAENDMFDENDLAEIRAERSTTKKIELALSKLKTAAKTAPKADKDEINQKITQLNDQLRAEKGSKESLKAEYEGKIKEINTRAALTAHLSKYKTIYDELPAGIKQTTLKAIIDQALQDNKADFAVGEDGTLSLIGKDGTNVFGSDNRQLTVDSFLDKSFAPILKKSNAAATPNGVTPANQQTPTIIPAPGTVAATDHIRNHNAAALAAMEGGAKLV